MANSNNDEANYTRLLSLLDTPGELFTVLHEVWIGDIKEKTGLAGTALARLQNEGHGSSFKLALDALPSFDNPFDVMHVLEKAVPLFDRIDVESLFEFEKAVYETTRNDFVGGILRNKFMTRFESRPDEARAVISKHLAEPTDETGPIFRAALIGLAAEHFQEAIEVALDAVESLDFSTSANAISALGYFNFDGDQHLTELKRVLKTIEKHAYAPDSKLLYVSAMALQNIVSEHHSYHPKLKRLLEIRTKEGVYAVTECLWRNKDKFKNEEWFYDLLNLCTKVPADFQDAISHLDFLLSDCLKENDSKIDIKKWLREWVNNQSSDNLPIDIPELLDSTFRELLIQREILETIFTEWLIHDDLRYPAAIHEMAGDMAVKKVLSISFDPTLLSVMDKEDLILLTRRTFGWIFNATIRINLLWSLTKAENASDKTYGIVLSAFSDILGYEYPPDVKNFINTIRSESKDSDLIMLCDNIVSSIDAYAANLDRLAPVKELHTSPEKYRTFRKARDKEMSKAQEKANEQSVFLQLVSQISVKAGTGSFVKTPDGSGYSGRSPFSSFETKITIPRSVVINTVGSEHQLLLFRNSKRGD